MAIDTLEPQRAFTARTDTDTLLIQKELDVIAAESYCREQCILLGKLGQRLCAYEALATNQENSRIRSIHLGTRAMSIRSCQETIARYGYGAMPVHQTTPIPQQ